MSSSAKFDRTRAGDYAQQSRIALAGYDACHELAAGLLAVAVGEQPDAELLIVGAGGTGQEILCSAPLQPGWRYTAVDPAAAMLNLAKAAVETAGLDGRTRWLCGALDTLPGEARYDAATLIGVLHHLPGQTAKQALLNEIAKRLKPGAPFILAGNRGAYRADPLFLAAWGERWRRVGSSRDEIGTKLGVILDGADPPSSDEAVRRLLNDAGFEAPKLFFSSLFWGGWITRRRAGLQEEKL